MANFFIAEDDPLMSRMYERAFRLSGHSVTMATDGEKALEALTHLSPKPDLIILDVMMPKVSGFDVLAKIKLDASLKDIPVVMLTNLAGKEDTEKALAMGALSYLIKSDYNPKEVVEKMVAFSAGEK